MDMKSIRFCLRVFLMVIIVMTFMYLTTKNSFGQTRWLKSEENPVLIPDEYDKCLSSPDPTVIKDGDTFKMWYVDGYPDTICYATSVDGIHWVKYDQNPVMAASEEWESNDVDSPTVIKDGGLYKMWYETGDWIGYATSVDGINWNKCSENPVLKPGPPGSWDDGSVYDACVIKDGDTYKMWYGGEHPEPYDYEHIGYATSSDGINWTKYLENPVFIPCPSGKCEAESPSVIKAGSLYEFWYGRSKGICYATSSDGVNWVKYLGNPVLQSGPPGSWDSGEVCGCTVIKDGDIYKMWYSGDDDVVGGIGYAIGEKTTIPIPDIKANGSDDPLFVTPSESVDISISLDPGDMAGEWADWWGILLSPYGTFPLFGFQCPLFELPDTSLFSRPWPVGWYIFLFGLDDVPDGAFELDWYDYVVVVSQPAGTQLENIPNFDDIVKEKMRELTGE